MILIIKCSESEICKSTCLNGGICLLLNCLCLAGFTGSKCQCNLVLLSNSLILNIDK